MNVLHQFFLITRGWSFPLSLSTVTLGTFSAFGRAPFSLGLYLTCLFGASAFHASTNALNDYFDYKYGIDTPDSPTVLYRPHGIFQNIITPKNLLYLALGLSSLAVITGICLVQTRCVQLWPIFLTGIGLNSFYTLFPKYSLKYLALGEGAVFLGFGPLLMEGSYAIQTQELSWDVFLLSIPVGILISLVLFANNLRDREFDANKGIKTLATEFSLQKGKTIFAVLAFLPYVIIGLYCLTGFVKTSAFLTFLSLPMTIKYVTEFLKKIPLAADAIISKIALIFNLLLLTSLVINRFL